MMDTQTINALILLRKIKKPLRIPTICWLLSDYLDVIDSKAREIVSTLKDRGLVKITSGGWVERIR